jgi:hypothetical protein
MFGCGMAAPLPIRKALHTIDIHNTETIDHARLLPKSASKLKTTVKDLATKVR